MEVKGQGPGRPLRWQHWDVQVHLLIAVCQILWFQAASRCFINFDFVNCFAVIKYEILHKADLITVSGA